VRLCRHDVCFACVKRWCTLYDGDSCPTCRAPYEMYDFEEFHRLREERERFDRLGTGFTVTYTPHVCVGRHSFSTTMSLNNKM